MIDLTNSLQVSSGKAMLVTWSLLYPPNYASLYRAISRINGPPRTQWSLPLSNCFTDGTMPCGPDNDDDGVIDSLEGYSGTNPSLVDTDGDGCSDGEETGIFPSSGGDRAGASPWDFYDVPAPALRDNPAGTRDKGIGVTTDVTALLRYAGITFTHPDYQADRDGNGQQDGLQYDRSLSTTPGKPWRSGPPDGGIGITTDYAAAMNHQIAHTCVPPP